MSYALGAFFSGMVLRESEFSHRAAEESLPLREAFAVLFFVSVGMLFKPAILLESPIKVIMVAGALLSIALNPLVFYAVNRLELWINRKPRLNRYFSHRHDPLSQLDYNTADKYLSKHIVLVGYGRVGGRIGEQLKSNSIPFVVVEQNRELVKRIRDSQTEAVSGNALEPNVLIQAHIANARILVIAIPDTFSLRNMISTARTLNPSIKILLRCHDEEELRMLKREVDCDVFLGEEELAKSMTKKMLDAFR